MTGTLLTVGLAIIILPTLLLVLMPLIDKILNNDVIYSINNIIDYIEYLIGSTNTTLLYGVIGIIIVMPIIRRFFSFFNGNKNGE